MKFDYFTNQKMNSILMGCKNPRCVMKVPFFFYLNIFTSKWVSPRHHPSENSTEGSKNGVPHIRDVIRTLTLIVPYSEDTNPIPYTITIGILS